MIRPAHLLSLFALLALLWLPVLPAAAWQAAASQDADAAAESESESESASASGEPTVASVARGLKFRSIGPALMSGRISDIAIDSVKPNTW